VGEFKLDSACERNSINQPSSTADREPENYVHSNSERRQQPLCNKKKYKLKNEK
jgi:hypothetical protein